MNKLYECMKTKNVNNSHAREAIYGVLEQEASCICVSEIIHALEERYPRKISLNTVYRHLTLFVECGLVIVMQDDNKKAYYALVGDVAKAFRLCIKCNTLSILENRVNLGLALATLDNTEFITLHEKCDRCK